MPHANMLYVDLDAATIGEGKTAYGMIESAATAVVGGMIAWVGPLTDLPKEFSEIPRTSLEGRIVTPSLTDCHTHIVHSGDRAIEFEMRLNGTTYEEVARTGRGIVSTVTATRAALTY